MSFSKHFHSFNGDQSNQSSSDEEITSKDYEKIQTLWKDLRQTKKNTDTSRPVKKNETLNLKSTGEYMPQNNLSSLEKQLTMAQDEVTLLRKKLRDAEAEIERCHTKIAKQLNVNAVQSNQLEDITAKFENLNLMHKELVEKSKETSQTLLRQLTEREKENEKLKFQMKERVDKLSIVSQSFEHANNKASQLETTISEKSGEINYLKCKLEETERLVEELQESREYDNAALEEVEHLRAEVQRLMRMLKTTKEFKEFGEYMVETEGTKRFLKDAVKHKRTSSSDHNRTGSTLGTQRLSVGAYADEKDLWVPQDAYRIIQEFIRKYRGSLNEENMETLLFDLNRIWTKREEVKIEKLLSQHKHELSKMKRKLTSNMSFDEVQSKRSIPRLSTDTQKENQKSSFNISQKLPPSVRVVSGTMRSVNRSERMQEDYAIENKTLKPHQRPSTATRRRGDSFEVENDVVGELERLKIKLEEILEEFIIKRKEILSAYNGHPDISIVIRKEDWLLESIESLIGQFCRGQNVIKGRKSEKSVNNSMLLNYSMI